MIRQIGNKIFFFKCRRQSVCSSDSNTKYRSEPLEKIYFEPDHNCFYDDFFYSFIFANNSYLFHLFFLPYNIIIFNLRYIRSHYIKTTFVWGDILVFLT